jgi:hypothetical protein
MVMVVVVVVDDDVDRDCANECLIFFDFGCVLAMSASPRRSLFATSRTNDQS